MREVPVMTQENSESAVKATQGREAAGGERHGLWWAEATIWTDRMVSALGNGVRGGKWFSLVDKVNRPSTELSPKIGDGGNREGGISWGCLTPPLLHRRSDMPCPTITSSI